jgi:hypothetical protein
MFYKTALMPECLITNITIIRALTTTDITGIPAFSTVCILVIQSALGKTQRLNIRIYLLIKRTIIFITMCTLHKNPMHWKNCVIYKSEFND